MRSTSLAALLIGLGIGFAIMYPLMKKRAPQVLSAMPVPFVPSSASGADASPPPMDIRRFNQLQETVAKDPMNFDALVELGNMQSDQRHFPEAAEWYTKALAVRESVDVRKYLGIALYNANRVDDAIAQFRKALETDPSNPEALYDLGVALLEGKNDADGAIEMWETLIRLNPNYAGNDVVRRNIQAVKENRQ
ncbi:MAG TPA: tetratricopeptide repeat protein [Terriglobia bacterium]|nr:tetratricopeptide repeat protein [Terriglobia bacterium]